MRPSSSNSELLRPGGSELDEALSDEALLRSMLEAEAALAAAGADAGVLPAAAADAIAGACRELRVDPAELGREGARAGNPVPALVRRLSAALPETARPWVHHGATSQDILDTALVLVARRTGRLAGERLGAAADACAGLAGEHRDTVMIGRTLGQQAEPTTFGRKAAGWLAGLDGSAERLDRALGGLGAQLGGAVGTLAALGPAGAAVRAAFARRLGLTCPVLPWHTERLPLLDLAGALGEVAAATGKVAVDVLLMAQTEVGEVSLAGAGGSSAMPHKRNPVAAVLVNAGAREVPGLLACLFAAGVHEHERATGAWHAEWQPWRRLLHVCTAMAGQTRELLAGLAVHTDRMRANLDALGGLPLAASVAARLAPALGRSEAHELVAACAERAAAAGGGFAEVLLAEPGVAAHLDPAQVHAALRPESWLGSAPEMVDAALAEHARRRAAGGGAR